MEKMRYKPSDKVRIKSLDWYNENKDELGNMDCGDALMITEKSQFCGKIVTISNVSDVIDAYKIEEDNGYYNWTDEMIEGLVEEEIIDIDDFQDDNEIIDVIDEYVHRLKNNECQINLPEGYQFTDENGNVINAMKIVLERKKKEYPKSYEECCKVMGIPIHGGIALVGNWCMEDGYIEQHLETLRALSKLLICRDAYWKIAGEEMGLGKPWKPDWNTSEPKYVIAYTSRGIEKQWETTYCKGFAFPTAEMLDAFYENFKELIESCKELL